MELLQLRYFCDAAVTQNLSKTAKKYHVPTSNISQSIKRLEKELGCELFDHRANKISLNDDGKRFLASADQALSLLDNAKEELGVHSGEIRGELKIACCCNRKNVTEAIEIFRRQVPLVNMSICHSINSDEDFDIIISDICPYAHSEKILLIDEEIRLAISREHPLAQREDFSTDELQNERFITMTESSSLYRITQKVCTDSGFTPNVAIQTDDPFYLRKYIELGLGIAFVPARSWQGLFSEDVILKRLSGVTRKSYAYIPNSTNSKHSKPSVDKFIKILKEVTADMR